MMGNREAAQQRFSAASQPDERLAPVQTRVLSPDRAVVGQPVDKFDRAVMLNLEPLSHLADCRTHVFGESFDGKQELVLLWFDPVRSGSLRAEL